MLPNASCFFPSLQRVKDVAGLKPQRKHMGGERGGGRESAKDDRKKVYTP